MPLFFLPRYSVFEVQQNLSKRKSPKWNNRLVIDWFCIWIMEKNKFT